MRKMEMNIVVASPESEVRPLGCLYLSACKSSFDTVLPAPAPGKMAQAIKVLIYELRQQLSSQSLLLVL